MLKINGNTCVFIQSIIDNFSRFVLAWNVTPNYGGLTTKMLLQKALAKSKELGISIVPEVFVDSGTENLNYHVDELVANGQITRTIAQIEIDFSNSMVEALFSRLKHNYLYLKNLSSIGVVQQHVDKYLIDSNENMPQPVLNGATPLEMITGKWTIEYQSKLIQQTNSARIKRKHENKSSQCKICLV